MAPGLTTPVCRLAASSRSSRGDGVLLGSAPGRSRRCGCRSGSSPGRGRGYTPRQTRRGSGSFATGVWRARSPTAVPPRAGPGPRACLTLAVSHRIPAAVCPVWGRGKKEGLSQCGSPVLFSMNLSCKNCGIARAREFFDGHLFWERTVSNTHIRPVFAFYKALHENAGSGSLPCSAVWTPGVRSYTETSLHRCRGPVKQTLQGAGRLSCAGYKSIGAFSRFGSLWGTVKSHAG